MMEGASLEEEEPDLCWEGSPCEPMRDDKNSMIRNRPPVPFSGYGILLMDDDVRADVSTHAFLKTSHIAAQIAPRSPPPPRWEFSIFSFLSRFLLLSHRSYGESAPRRRNEEEMVSGSTCGDPFCLVPAPNKRGPSDKPKTGQTGP
jgi:hypothetical protein